MCYIDFSISMYLKLCFSALPQVACCFYKTVDYIYLYNIHIVLLIAIVIEKSNGV